MNVGTNFGAFSVIIQQARQSGEVIQDSYKIGVKLRSIREIGVFCLVGKQESQMTLAVLRREDLDSYQ